MSQTILFNCNSVHVQCMTIVRLGSECYLFSLLTHSSILHCNCRNAKQGTPGNMATACYYLASTELTSCLAVRLYGQHHLAVWQATESWVGAYRNKLTAELHTAAQSQIIIPCIMNLSIVVTQTHNMQDSVLECTM